MSLLRELEKATRAAKGTLRKFRNAESAEMRIEAPAGRRWSATSTHEVVFMGASGPKAAEDWDNLAKLLLPDVQGGTEPCEDADCEWCNDNAHAQTLADALKACTGATSVTVTDGDQKAVSRTVCTYEENSVSQKKPCYRRCTRYAGHAEEHAMSSWCLR